MRRGAGAPLVLALALAWCAPAGATTVPDLSVSEMATRSELIFTGRVVDQSSHLDRQVIDGRTSVRVLTDTTFAVEQVLKGEKVRTFTLTQIGGTAGEGTERRTQVIWGQATFTVGESVVLFLEHADTGRWVVTGLAQGKYTLHGDLAVRGNWSAEREKVRAARVRTLIGVSTPDRLPLNQLEALIRGERPAPTPVKVVRTPQVEVAP
jgi:hypothetical protein